jgi:hypothetical protein
MNGTNSLREIATPNETGELEKKASAKFDTSTEAKKRETKNELLKQACAFANASRGYLVYGIAAGVAGKSSASAWRTRGQP